ncbi:MAG TPA: hypothetical protein DCE56_41665 [Cyanobacteria bacterium UBA8553]|nr:hypothetical protein [Cyanobacteria bacterium UBA8553]
MERIKHKKQRGLAPIPSREKRDNHPQKSNWLFVVCKYIFQPLTINHFYMPGTGSFGVSSICSKPTIGTTTLQ